MIEVGSPLRARDDLVGDALDLLRGLRGDQQLARIGAVERVDGERGVARVREATGHDRDPDPAVPAPPGVPDRLHAEGGEQQQRQERVQHQPGELLARPRVDDQRDGEGPDQEHAQERRPPEREHGSHGPEQQHRPLVAEQDDEVEVPGLAAAADLVLAEPVLEAGVEPAHAVGVREEGGEEQRVDAEEGGQAPAPRVEADGTERAKQQLAPEQQHAGEERERHEAGDEGRLLGGEREREQRADQGRLVASRALEEAEGDHEQRERDRREVDVLAGEAREVQEGGPEGEQRGGGEGADAADLPAQQVGERDHQRPHQRRGEPGAEVRVAEQGVHPRGQVEAQRPVQERVVLVVALREEDPREVGVLALVVVERPVAEVDETQRQRHGHEQRVGRELAARPPRLRSGLLPRLGGDHQAPASSRAPRRRPSPP